jgi:hypothetical protein
VNDPGERSASNRDARVVAPRTEYDRDQVTERAAQLRAMEAAGANLPEAVGDALWVAENELDTFGAATVGPLLEQGLDRVAASWNAENGRHMFVIGDDGESCRRCGLSYGLCPHYTASEVLRDADI